MTSISDIIVQKTNRILFDSDDIQIVKKEKKVDLTNHRVGDDIHVSQNDMQTMLPAEDRASALSESQRKSRRTKTRLSMKSK